MRGVGLKRVAQCRERLAYDPRYHFAERLRKSCLGRHPASGYDSRQYNSNRDDGDQKNRREDEQVA